MCPPHFKFKEVYPKAPRSHVTKKRQVYFVTSKPSPRSASQETPARYLCDKKTTGLICHILPLAEMSSYRGRIEDGSLAALPCHTACRADRRSAGHHATSELQRAATHAPGNTMAARFDSPLCTQHPKEPFDRLGSSIEPWRYGSQGQPWPKSPRRHSRQWRRFTHSPRSSCRR